MRELVVRQKILAAGLFCFMPASESLQHDSMHNLVSRTFLFSLWWKELMCLSVLVCLALVVAARIALRSKAAQRVAMIALPRTLSKDSKNWRSTANAKPNN